MGSFGRDVEDFVDKNFNLNILPKAPKPPDVPDAPQRDTEAQRRRRRALIEAIQSQVTGRGRAATQTGAGREDAFRAAPLLKRGARG